MGRKSPRQYGLFQRFVAEPRDPRGRPAVAWDAQTSELVVDLRSLRKPQEFIAQAVGLSVKTLVRIYPDELAAADELVKTSIDVAVLRKAREGHTASARLAYERLDRHVAQDLAMPAAPDVAPREPKLGKKELSRQVAGSIRGLFAPGPPPKTAH